LRAESVELRAANRRIRLLDQENEVLRRAGSVFVTGKPAGKRLYPLVSKVLERSAGLHRDCCAAGSDVDP